MVARSAWSFERRDAGTVVVRTEFTDSSEHWFVITRAGPTLELRPGDSVADLSDADQMVGSGRNPNTAAAGSPLYWASLSAAPVALPVIQDGYGGQAQWFQGLDILGTLADASGNWLVRWSRIGGTWNVVRVQQIPDKHYLTGVGSSGRLALMHCAATKYAFGSPIGCDWRAAVWDPPYIGAPTYLPNVAGTYSWTGPVLDDDTVVGVTVASNNVDMLPVLWPTPVTLIKLPLLIRRQRWWRTRLQQPRTARGPRGYPGQGTIEVPCRGVDAALRDHPVFMSRWNPGSCGRRWP